MIENNFRGKSNSKWVFGSLVAGNKPCIVNGIIEANDEFMTIAQWAQVRPETIGRYTGFKDIKGVDIFEGDIIGDWTDTDEGLVQSKCQVFWCCKTGTWLIDQSLQQNKIDGVALWLELNDFKYEVIGNIHDNPELLNK